MLILKYFAAVGTLLATVLLALNAYLDPSGSSAAARVSSMTTASVSLALPATPTESVAKPDVPQPKVAAASAPKSNSAHHRHRVR